ncbi:MAG: MBL fold metallo-hydrolase [Deinococcota bacterium]
MTNLSRRSLLKSFGAWSLAGAAAASWQGLKGQAWAQDAMNTMRVLPTEGSIVQLPKQGATLHSYVSPEAGVLVTSHIIETERQLVIVDTTLLPNTAAELRSYADSLGKPIDRVIISHAHPDHWSGLTSFGDVPIVTTANVRADIAQQVNADTPLPANALDETATLTAGNEVLDGLTFEYLLYDDAEAPEQIVVHLPELGILVAQDLVYNNVYFFPGTNRANWISILQSLQTMDNADVILPGHGFPTTRGELDSAIDFLNVFNEAVEAATDEASLQDALRQAYPNYGGAFLLNFVGMAL